MRLIPLRASSGYTSIISFLVGFIILVSAAWMVRYNIMTTAAANSELLGGTVILSEVDPWFPDLKIVDGGALGLFFGYAMAAIFFAVQWLFWSANSNKLSEQTELFQWFAKSTMVVDFLSAVYAMMGGTHVLDLFAQDWAAATARLLWALFVALGFLSIGAEIWLSLGFELVRLNFEPAMMTFGGALKFIFSVINKAFLAAEKANNTVSSSAVGQERRPDGRDQYRGQGQGSIADRVRERHDAGGGPERR